MEKGFSHLFLTFQQWKQRKIDTLAPGDSIRCVDCHGSGKVDSGYCDRHFCDDDHTCGTCDGTGLFSFECARVIAEHDNIIIEIERHVNRIPAEDYFKEMIQVMMKWAGYAGEPVSPLLKAFDQFTYANGQSIYSGRLNPFTEVLVAWEKQKSDHPKLVSYINQDQKECA
jgi:hypothetical protein